MSDEIRLLTDLTAQVGELHGKMDLVLNRLDKINGRIDQHNSWIAAHEALHAANRGESNVRRNIRDRAWNLAGPVIGALAGFLFSRLRLARLIQVLIGVMRE